MKVYQFPEEPAPGVYGHLVSDLLDAPIIHTGEWQSMDTSKSAIHSTHELEDVSLVWDRIPQSASGVHNIFPAIDQPWATTHFEERVSGRAYNPAPSHLDWPYAVRGNGNHMTNEVFDHTYPERFWPQHAGHHHQYHPEAGFHDDDICGGRAGIRFHYGDLNSVVDLLARSPLTRQAFLPVWFPEDTGSVDGQRVPCTLGYHFMQRGGRLSMRYYMRSCDVYRHLSNDVFFAAALMHWMCNRVYEATVLNEAPVRFRPGGLIMHISSLHAFIADEKKINARMSAVLA